MAEWVVGVARHSSDQVDQQRGAAEHDGGQRDEKDAGEPARFLFHGPSLRFHASWRSVTPVVPERRGNQRPVNDAVDGPGQTAPALLEGDAPSWMGERLAAMLEGELRAVEAVGKEHV